MQKAGYKTPYSAIVAFIKDFLDDIQEQRSMGHIGEAAFSIFLLTTLMFIGVVSTGVFAVVLFVTAHELITNPQWWMILPGLAIVA